MRGSLACCGVAALLCAAPLTCAHGQADSFERSFAAPPPDARPMMRWWWFGPAVDKLELAREIAQMQAAGVGGFEIQPVYPLALDRAPDPALDPAIDPELDDKQTGSRNLPYLSSEFLNAVSFANEEGHRQGLRVSLTLSSGWPYGGPHTTVDEAAGALRVVHTAADAGGATAAVPALGPGETLLAAFLTAGSDSTGDACASNCAPACAPCRPLPLPDLPAVRVALPPATAPGSGILWFISSRTGQQVKRAAAGAEGFVLDHFSREAVDAHLHTVADPLLAAFGDHPPYSVFSDSLEVYGSDWTPDLLAQFRNRRGYDLRPHLPQLVSAHPDDEAQAVRHDWGQTLTELVNENYLQPIGDWAKAHGTLFRSQTYGAPAVSLASNALVDLPEGEGPQWRQFSYTRWATSAAHAYGRPVVSAETWTWLHSPAFRATPLDMQAEANLFFLQGVNQLVGHGWAYSPPSAGEPGWRFYAAGVFNAHNPWWPVMPDLMRSLQRVSWALRQGEPVEDVAIYLPEDDAYAAFTPGLVSLSDLMPRWITPALTAAIEDSGYGFDYVDSATMAQRGIHARVLVLPGVDRMTPETLAHIEQYRQGGGKVFAVERVPAHTPGWLHRDEGNAAVQAAATELFRQPGAMLVSDAAALGAALPGMALPGMALPSMVQPSMVQPDVRLTPRAPLVGFVHRRLAGADLYFFANTGNVSVRSTLEVRAQGTLKEWLDPDTGGARLASSGDCGGSGNVAGGNRGGSGKFAGSGNSLLLDLQPYESRLLLVGGETKKPGEPCLPGLRPQASRILVDVSGGWHVQFAGETAWHAMATLTSWTGESWTPSEPIGNPTGNPTGEPGRRFYSGTATYRRKLTLAQTPGPGTRLTLDFGAGRPLPEPADAAGHPGMQALLDPPIREAAVVIVNGKRAGALWRPPYALDVTSLLQAGDNTLEVEVGNTAINEMAGQDQPDYRLLWAFYGKRFAPQDMEHLEPLPSGLLGPVTLVETRAP